MTTRSPAFKPSTNLDRRAGLRADLHLARVRDAVAVDDEDLERLAVGNQRLDRNDDGRRSRCNAMAPKTVSPIRSGRRVVAACTRIGHAARRRVDDAGHVDHPADAERLAGRGLPGVSDVFAPG